MTEAPTQRSIPGAPPPAPLSKSAAKKKRKGGATGGTDSAKPPASPASVTVAIPDATSAALVEKAPDAEEIKEGSVAPELVVNAEPTREATPAPAATDEPKRSPVYELVNKRQKNLGKKITRFQSYAVQDQSKLNDDQRRSLKTLPTLEAVHKELEDVKKAIEDYDAEQAGAIAAQKAEREAIEAQKITDAVAGAEAGHISRTLDLLTLVRIHSGLSQGSPQAVALGLNEPESSAIFGIVDVLLGEDGGNRETIVRGFLTSEGDYNSVPYLRLQEIVNSFLNPVATITGPSEPTNGVNGESYLEVEPPVVINRAPSAGPTINAYHFMNASELDNDQEVAPDVPVVEQTEVTFIENEEEPPVTITETLTVTELAPGVEIVEDQVVIEAEPTGGIDWSADPHDQGLPSVHDLHASFGIEPAPTADGGDVAPDSAEPGTPGVDADGFSAARGRGGRGQRRGGGDGRGGGRGMRGGFRGSRGGFRNDRGGYEGGGFRNDRGGHEGGGFRSDYLPGGEGGERGGYRGGGRGGPRGGGGPEGERGGYRGGRGGDRGSFRGERGGGAPRGGRSEGEWRNSGDGRGRGRGRGRGGFQEGRGNAPPPQAE